MTAYQNWLVENYKTVEDIGAEIYAEILIDRNPQAQELVSNYLDTQADKTIKRETFYETAKKLLADYESEKGENKNE